MEAANVVDLGVLDEAPDLGLLQVVKAVVVSSTKVSNETAVVASNDSTTAAGLLLGVNTVLDAEASLLDGILEDGGVLVVTSTTKVDNAVGGQDVLGTTGGVLGSTTRNQLGVIVVEKLLIQRDVLLLSQNGVVGLQLILIQQSLVSLSLNIYGETVSNILQGGAGHPGGKAN